MDEETARLIYTRIQACNPMFDALADAIDRLEDEAMRKGFRRAVGEAMAEIIIEIQRPLERAYPSLAA
jgi:hypothetical protein